MSPGGFPPVSTLVFLVFLSVNVMYVSLLLYEYKFLPFKKKVVF
jgi:hypothetical protein